MFNNIQDSHDVVKYYFIKRRVRIVTNNTINLCQEFSHTVPGEYVRGDDALYGTIRWLSWISCNTGHMHDCIVRLMEVWLRDMCSSNPSAIFCFLTVYFDTPGAIFVLISSINAMALHCINLPRAAKILVYRYWKIHLTTIMFVSAMRYISTIQLLVDP